MNKKSLKSIIVLGSICLVVALLLSGVNAITAPIIKEQEESSKNAAYDDILPGATELVELTDDFSAYESIVKVMKDTGGAGFVFELSTSKGYTKSPINILLSVDASGNIIKFDITAFPETMGSEAGFEELYTGKTIPVADVLSGATISSTAIQNAIKEAYDVFCAYAGVEKSDDQKLADLYSVVLPYGTDKAGSYNLSAIDIPAGAPASITAIYAPNTGVGYIMTAKSGDTTVVMGVNAYGKVFAIYDLDGKDLTGDTAFSSVIADAESIPSIYADNSEAVLELMKTKGIIASADDAAEVDFGAVSSRVTAVYELADGYAYIARSEGFGGILEVCYVISDNGDIVNYATLEQFEVAEREYMNSDFGTVIAKSDYASGIIGNSADTLTEDGVIVAGSTFTSNAVKACWIDIKAAYEILQGGNQ